MNKTSILIVEDEQSICNFIATTLNAHENKTLRCQTGKEALAIIPSHCPDLILLDLGLPDMDGIEVLKSVRSWSTIPIIIISARSQEAEKVQSLDLGADDYITKPFGTSELLARIRTAIRHNLKTTHIEQGSHIFKAGDLTIDYDKHMLLVGSEKVHLTQIEFKLISLLAQHSGKVLTYDFMIKQIWGPYASSNNQILRVNMANIRRKIEQNPGDPKYIFTEVGIGYRMIEEQD